MAPPSRFPKGSRSAARWCPSAIAARVDGELRDLSYVPAGDAAVEPVDVRTDDGLHVLRHSTAHVLAQAVSRLWPGTKLGIGPTIADGFYYDLAIPKHVSVDDLPKIEETMRAIVAEDQAFVREDVDREEALRRLTDQPFKREIVEGLAAEEGAGDIAAGAQTASFYRNDGWEDLCLGPHVPSSGRLGAFTLTAVSGAYWRGDEKNPQLTRIYGTAWATQEDLDAYLLRMEEAERRDHRKLGVDLDLFSFPEEIGSGLAVFHPRGGLVRMIMEDYSRQRHVEGDYEFVYSPHITKPSCSTRAGIWSGTRRGMSCDGARRRHGVLPEADELPVPRADLQGANTLLPRAAATAVRVRRRLPLREVRRRARSHART